MKRMNILIKISLTLVFVLQGFLFAYLLFPVELNSLLPTYENYQLVSAVIGVCMAIGYGYIFYRLNKIKTTTPKTERGLWGMLIVFLPIILGLIYVWHKDDKFE
jgi:phosphoglycerol transferase MdoB-like AlkP superfamily enzyme